MKDTYTKSSASFELDRCHGLTHGTFISFDHVFVFVGRFECYLRVFCIEFDKEAIYDVFMAHSRIFLDGGRF